MCVFFFVFFLFKLFGSIKSIKVFFQRNLKETLCIRKSFIYWQIIIDKLSKLFLLLNQSSITNLFRTTFEERKKVSHYTVQKHSNCIPSYDCIVFISSQAFHSIAKCAAALTMACKSEAEGIINKFVADIKVSRIKQIYYMRSVRYRIL